MCVSVTERERERERDREREGYRRNRYTRQKHAAQKILITSWIWVGFWKWKKLGLWTYGAIFPIQSNCWVWLTQLLNPAHSLCNFELNYWLFEKLYWNMINLIILKKIFFLLYVWSNSQFSLISLKSTNFPPICLGNE